MSLDIALQSSVLATLVSGIFSVLKGGNPSRKELERLRTDLSKLLFAASCFFELERRISEGLVHADELYKFLNYYKTSSRTINESLLSLGQRVKEAEDMFTQIPGYKKEYESLRAVRWRLRRARRNEMTARKELRASRRTLEQLLKVFRTKRHKLLQPLLIH